MTRPLEKICISIVCLNLTKSKWDIVLISSQEIAFFSEGFPWLPFRYVEGGIEVVIIFQKSLNRYANIVSNGRTL